MLCRCTRCGFGGDEDDLVDGRCPDCGHAAIVRASRMRTWGLGKEDELEEAFRKEQEDSE